jgi:hypothetical protein
VNSTSRRTSAIRGWIVPASLRNRVYCWRAQPASIASSIVGLRSRWTTPSTSSRCAAPGRSAARATPASIASDATLLRHYRAVRRLSRKSTRPARGFPVDGQIGRVSSRLLLPGRTGRALPGPSRSRWEACDPRRCRVAVRTLPASPGRGAVQEAGTLSGATAVRRGAGR